MGEGNVISLDAALRLTRANTRRSSRYEAKASRLNRAGERRLDALEQSLFDARERLEDCACGQLGKLERTFDCPLGRVWYYFSKPARRFVLLDFDFGRGGSGGLPIPCEAPGDVQRWTGRAAAGRLVARRVLRPCVLSGPERGPSGDGATRHLRRMQRSCASDHDAWDRGVLAALLVGVGCGDRPSGGRGRAVDRAGVPTWSVLSGFVCAHEQLENDFARSILLGEALCREASGTSLGRALLSRSKAKRIRPGTLLRESASALDLMLCDGAHVGTKFRRLRITGAFRRCLLADDVHLSVVRLELTAHLSMHVMASASSPGPLRDGRRRSVDLMRKYALLADFAVLTDGLFETGRPILDGSHACREVKAALGGRSATKAWRDLGSLEGVLRWLVGCLSEGRRINDLTHEPSSLHRRLVLLTEELLAPIG